MPAPIEKVRALEREGVLLSAYRRSDGEGVVVILQVDSVEQARARTGELPFAACWRSSSPRSRHSRPPN